MKNNNWARLLAYVSRLINQELLRRNEYLAAENRILRAHLPARLRLTDPERSTLAEIGKRLGRKALKELACVAKPDTILAWHRRLIAGKFDGSNLRSYPGRPRISREVTELIVRMAKENSGWGYDRIVGALANLGHVVSDQTVGNVLRRHGIAPAPKRSQTTSWKEFIAAHMAVLAGIDFFTVEAVTWRGLATYYGLVLSSSGDKARQLGRDHTPSDRDLDGADRSQCDRRSFRAPASHSLRSSRPRHQVHRIVPGDIVVGRCSAAEAPAAESESEGLRFTLHLLRTADDILLKRPSFREFDTLCLSRWIGSGVLI